MVPVPLVQVEKECPVSVRPVLVLVMLKACAAAALRVVPGLPLLQVEKECEAAALDVLHNKCAVQDVFADSRFLKQEALQVGRQPQTPYTLCCISINLRSDWL